MVSSPALWAPADWGQFFKPFVFLDLFDNVGEPFTGFDLHPHSGLATLTYVVEGGVSYEHTNGSSILPLRKDRSRRLERGLNFTRVSLVTSALSAIRAHWDEINALCHLNGIPFNATGERIQSGGMWCVYEFTWQLDAMQFWDRFEGRWMVGSEFHFPERPKDLPPMKQLQGWPKFDPRKARG